MFNCWLKAGTWALHTLSHRILKKKKKRNVSVLLSKRVKYLSMVFDLGSLRWDPAVSDRI